MIRYIADTHFDNEDILSYDNRPFDTAEEMNEALIANWNRVVKEEDLTFIIGDFHAGNAERWRDTLQKLNGKKALIKGNHDAWETIEEVRDLFEEVTEYKELTDGEDHVVLCHYPSPAFHNHYFGWIHLYGHVHGSFEANILEKDKQLLKKLYAKETVCRMTNVGAMMPYMDYTPRTLAELKEVL